MPEFLILPSIVGCFILLDIVSGIAQAVANHNVSSEKLREGAFHKMAFVLIICLAYLIDYGVAYIDLGFDFPIVVPTCAYIILTEVVSIVENVVRLNPSLKGSKIVHIFDTDKNDDVEKVEIINQEKAGENV